MDFLKNQALKKYNQVKAAVLKHSYKLQASTFGFLVILPRQPAGIKCGYDKW